MFLALRSKLAVFDSYINPFNRRGALRLSRYHPKAYRLLTLLGGLAGYLFLCLFPLLAATMPVALYLTLPVATAPWQWSLVAVEGLLAVAGVGGTLAVATLRFAPPSGLELVPASCPRLFELLQELGHIYGNPRIDRVVLRDRLDLRIVKTPRHGFSFTTRHTLVIGLPVLLTLSPIDVHALMARRIGQLAGSNSRIDSWLYYLRDMWAEYLRSCQNHRSWLVQPLYAFFAWYAPRYRSLSLGVARWCELEADLAALRAINDRDTVRAICGQAMVDDYLTRVFWPQVIETARSSMKPGKMPHARMAEVFASGLPEGEAQILLKRVATRRSNPRSTSPSLHERLENLAHRKPLPPKPVAVSAARFYLGGACDRCIETIDKRSRDKVREKVIRHAND